MTRYLTLIIGTMVTVSVALCVSLGAEPPIAGDYRPLWSKGQRWRVEVEKNTERKATPNGQLSKFTPEKYRIVYQFEVEGIQSVESELCIQLRIESVKLNDEGIDEPLFYRIFLRQADGTLKAVQRNNKQTGTMEVGRSFEAGPVDATDWCGFLPIAIPVLGEEQVVQAPRKSKDGKVAFKDLDRCRQNKEKARIRVDGQEVEALRVTLEKESQGGPSRLSIQTWVKGMPWWIDSTYFLDGKEWCSSKLLKD